MQSLQLSWNPLLVVISEEASNTDEGNDSPGEWTR